LAILYLLVKNNHKPIFYKQKYFYMINKTDIFLSLKKHHLILQKFGVIKCGLFGSFVTGKATEKSDVDLLIVFDPEKKTFNNFMDLCFFLEDLFDRKVDVLTPESLSPHFGDRILQEVEYVSF